MVNTILKAVGAPTPALATASGPNPTPSASVSRCTQLPGSCIANTVVLDRLEQSQIWRII